MRATPSLRGSSVEVEPLRYGRDEKYLLIDLDLADGERLPVRLEDRKDWPEVSEWIGRVTNRVPVTIGGHRTDLLLSTNNMGLPGSVGFIRDSRFGVLAQGRFCLTAFPQGLESDQEVMDRVMGIVVEHMGEVNGRLVLLVDDPGWVFPDERSD
jgi:hypothetical protein